MYILSAHIWINTLRLFLTFTSYNIMKHQINIHFKNNDLATSYAKWYGRLIQTGDHDTRRSSVIVEQNIIIAITFYFGFY